MKVALVTGATGGLGREIVRRLASHGFSVAVHYRTAAETAAALALELGKDSMPVCAELSSSREVRAMAYEVDRKYGRLDAVVNNAGITADSLLVRQTEADWDRLIAVNLTGCFHVMQAAVPLMIRSGGGQVVNVSSYSGVKGKAGQAAYSASKAALLGLTLSAAAEFGRDNVRVNAVLPGYMPTVLGSAAGKAMERARQESVLKSLSDPGESAEFIAWLASAGAISGQVFSLDSRII